MSDDCREEVFQQTARLGHIRKGAPNAPTQPNAGWAAAFARPAIAGKAQTLAIVPQVALNSIDPVWTSSQIARNMGFMVFDLLYGRDEQMNPRPQMLKAT